MHVILGTIIPFELAEHEDHFLSQEWDQVQAPGLQTVEVC
jgi:hypothetical protein